MKPVKLLFVAALAISVVPVFAGQADVSGALKQDVQKLLADVKSDVANSDVTQEELQNLKLAVYSIVSSAHKPDPADVSALATTLKSVKAAGSVKAAEKKLIKAEVQKTVASAGVTESQEAALMQSVLAIYQSSGFSKAELMELLTDLKTILADLPPAKPKA